MEKKAVVLLSGGLDSATTLALVKKDLAFVPFALSIFYGQRNQIEIQSAKMVAKYFNVKEHKILELDLRAFGGSALTSDIAVPEHINVQDKTIPITYVPARNTIMLSLALAYAEVVLANDIFYGANIHDYSGYPDCRPEYIEAFQKMANLSCKRAIEGHEIKIHAPLMNFNKAEIIKIGLKLGVDYSITHSCYDPMDNFACGKCSACHYRREGFLKAEVNDPTSYGSFFKA